MPEITDKCVFEVEADQITLQTRTNGDTIGIRGIDLDQENAAALAWLINHPGSLKIVIKQA